ncbi:MAG: hypothetical protein KIT84_37830 [Labilithrix sp.]|nr:hypothetical protein [Labilithrix sp.]MCW5816818.1 hypothetical protein [Labilithrix sp.]
MARVYNGRVVSGPFVPSEAYAAYLRGVLAEEAGDDKTALAAFEEAAREDDDEDPEPLVRIGAVRCRLDPKGRGADDAFAKAAKVDRTYAPLLAARARCAALRGHGDAAIATMDGIGRADREPSLEALWITLARARPAARERAIALTVASGERVAAWDALLAWGRAHHDAVLVARGLAGLLRVSPLRAREVEAGALELLGDGETGHARAVAAALADAPAELGPVRVQDATVARLAIDEALARGDVRAAERRALRGHVALAEVAGRALLLEEDAIATTLARRVLEADPANSGAAMVLAATGARLTDATKPGASAAKPPGVGDAAKPGGGADAAKLGGGLADAVVAATDRPAAACVLGLAARLAGRGDVEAARGFVARVEPDGIAPHDGVVGPVAVDLAVRGALADASLPIELRLEVAARRREPAPPLSPEKLDAKHALLFHTVVDPSGAPARALLARLAPAAEREPLIAYALARAALVVPPAPDASGALAALRAALAGSPADPLVAAVAVEIAKKSGRAEDVPPARARLLAVARTPAERALASE